MTPNPKLFEEMFSELSDFDPEKLTSLISEATSVLKTVVEKSKSSNPEDKAEATQTVTELKNSIEKQVSSMFESMGIDKNELQAFMSDPANFTPEEQNLINQINQELEQFKPQEIKTTEKLNRVINKKKRSTWLPG